ncbi:MAG: hypothetical protein FJ222_08385 [Lentisphaerae bacterium]|nr:hypothetical protein [Lentisphaerota bacterium]
MHNHNRRMLVGWGVRTTWVACIAASLTVTRMAFAADATVGEPKEAVAADTTLADRKAAFAALMNTRAGLAERVRESQAVIREARDTTGQSEGRNSETGKAYREAAIRVEQALDAHPRIKQVQEQIDEAQAKKVEVGRQLAEISDARHNVRKGASKQFNTAVADAGAAAEEARQALLKQAGVRDAKDLTEEDQPKYRAIHTRLTNEIAIARGALAQASATNAVAAGSEPGDILARFEEAKAHFAEIEQEQAELKTEMMQLRKTLRTEDPSIATLQEAAREATRTHASTMAAAPDVAEAHAFIRTVNTLRGDIDREARVLRRAILADDPACEAELNVLAQAAGLALAGDDFWDVK